VEYKLRPLYAPTAVRKMNCPRVYFPRSEDGPTPNEVTAMGKPLHIGAALLFCVPALVLAPQGPTPAGGVPASVAASGPATITTEGLIKLDVVVTDQSGKSVAGLKPTDFTLLDNEQPQKILSFQAFDGVTAQPDPPLEVILVIDTVNLPASQVPLAKSEAEKFLRRNHGQLAQPVSLYLLSSAGLSSMPGPSIDGNALADEIARGRELPVIRLTPIHVGLGFLADERNFASPRLADYMTQNSLRPFGFIVLEERRRPGRKLLFWLSPGWKVDPGTDKSFDRITELSTRVREARIAIWSWPYPDSEYSYERAPVKSHNDGVKAFDNALDVLALHSGGGRLNTSTYLAKMIGKCIEEESVFYTLTFDIPLTNEVDDYHDLKVAMNKPDLMARTIAGYYNEPSYREHPSEARPITVSQLEQMLEAAHGSKDNEVAQELSGVELTERMTSTRLSSWKGRLPGERSRAALVAVADRSAFLALPPADIPATATPDPAVRQQMLSRMVEYWTKTMLQLPDFSATRTTILYDEPPPTVDTWKIVTSDQSLHAIETSNTAVLYRGGKEVLDGGARKGKKKSLRENGFDTQGTFGPILAVIFHGFSESHSKFVWSHWEQGADGLQAVFRYVVPQAASHFEVNFCCLADPDGTIPLNKIAAYRGEIAIDPASGAILRVTVDADLEPRLPILSSAILVEYGPVVIGEKPYICPIRSVSISRWRGVVILTEWGQTFGVYGRYKTMLSDMIFGKYHMFRAQSRILPGYTPAPKEK
jgi:VWFA-related protein